MLGLTTNPTSLTTTILMLMTDQAILAVDAKARELVTQFRSGRFPVVRFVAPESVGREVMARFHQILSGDDLIETPT